MIKNYRAKAPSRKGRGRSSAGPARSLVPTLLIVYNSSTIYMNVGLDPG
jgi:hypothetical protein